MIESKGGGRGEEGGVAIVNLNSDLSLSEGVSSDEECPYSLFTRDLTRATLTYTKYVLYTH